MSEVQWVLIGIDRHPHTDTDYDGRRGSIPIGVYSDFVKAQDAALKEFGLGFDENDYEVYHLDWHPPDNDTGGYWVGCKDGFPKCAVFRLIADEIHTDIFNNWRIKSPEKVLPERECNG